MATTTMDITSNTIKYGAQIFQLRNITQIRVEAWKKAPRLGNVSILMLLALTWACWFYPTLPEEIYSAFSDAIAPRAMSLLLGLVTLCIAAYGIWNRTQLNFYTLYIETSSASSSLFSSRDKDGIQTSPTKSTPSWNSATRNWPTMSRSTNPGSLSATSSPTPTAR